MSCSKWLLNKKGPLATVWVAAFRRVEALTRDQVASTDLVASVDKILDDDQAPQRILALLLLGIVKIYSRKVEYIYLDCNKLLATNRCDEPSSSTGRSTHGVLRKVKKKAVRVGRQQDTTKVTESFHAVRTTEISGPISSERLSLRAETEIIVQTSVVVREARVSVDVPAFTRPERFELDSFDLGIPEDMDDDGEDHHQSERQDISLEDERHCAPILYESYQRATCSYAVGSACIMPEYIALPPEVIGAISEGSNILDLSTKWNEPERENQNADSVWFTPVKDVLPPEAMENVAKVKMDKDAGTTSSILLPESQKQQISENVLENMTASLAANYPTTEESENDLFLGNSNTGPAVGGFQEPETGENEMLEKSNTGPPLGGFQEHEPEEHETLERPVLSCRTQTIDDLSPSTPEPLPEGIPGPTLSPMVRTPANIEKRLGTRKRKKGFFSKDDYLPTERKEKQHRRILTDKVLILSNSIMKEGLNDTSDITRRRKNAPHTYFDTWKMAKIGSLPDNFMGPLIPYHTSVHLGSITTIEAPGSSCWVPVKARRRLSYKLSEPSHSCMDARATERESILDEPRMRKLDERTDFEAPIDIECGHLQDDVRGHNDDTAKVRGTPVNGDESEDHTPLHKGLHESENHTSLVPSDKGLHESENHTSLHDEASYAALENIDEDTPMDEEDTRDEGLLSSTRTRKVAGFLHQRFRDLNSNQGTNSLSLGHALEGKERRTSAIFFYETLVLKSRGLIEVNQERPYEDIMLSPTPQFEAELQRPSGGK